MAQALFMQRQLEFSKDSMETQCLPLGPAYLTTRYRDFRIVQTPTLIVLTFDDGMHREICGSPSATRGRPSAASTSR